MVMTLQTINFYIYYYNNSEVIRNHISKTDDSHLGADIPGNISHLELIEIS